VGSQGEQLGVLSIEAALEKAQTEGLDLVEVNPMSKPPVCKIMDYGASSTKRRRRPTTQRRSRSSSRSKR